MEQRDTKTSSTFPVRLDVLDKDQVAYSGEFVKEKIVLGRILSADLRVDDPSVSRIHALLEVRGNKLLLTDLASTHGTFVNGKKIVESEIKVGDRIRLGLTEIAVEAGSGQTTLSPAPSSEDHNLSSQETMVNIDRRKLEAEGERRERTDRRQKDAFPDEKRLDDRREGDRRIDQRKGDRRAQRAEEKNPPVLPPADGERRHEEGDRRQPRDWERRIGQRRRGDRRVFDITSLERRIEDRRTRNSDDDLLPEELEKAFAEPTHVRELEVTVLWGDHILDVSNYKDPMIINIGESPANHYVIPSTGIDDEFPLVTIEEDGNAVLAFTTEMKGTIRARDKIYDIPGLIQEKFVRKFGGYYLLPLRRDDFAKLAIGNINFFILYVKPAPRIKVAPLFDRDKLFLKALIVSFILSFLILGGASLIPEPKPVTIEMIPERFAKIIIRKKPKIPEPDIIDKTAKPQEKGSEKGMGGKQKAAEGKAKEMPKIEKNPTPPVQQARKTPEPPKPVAAKQPDPKPTPTPPKPKEVKQFGLLKTLGGSKSELKDMLNKDSGIEAFNKSKNYAASGTKGGTGVGLKGVDVGGGGNTIGIDGPSTSGLGRGDSGSGIGEGSYGPGRLGQKGEHTVSVATENVQVLSGLPKDVINAIVNRHRGEIRQCYEAARQRNPSVKGKVVIEFKIQPTGVVSYAGVKESTVGDSRLEDCIVSRTKSWIFPKPEAPVVTEVSAYPFYLNPGN